MCIFTKIRNRFALRKLHQGKAATLSIADVTALLIDVSAARRHCPEAYEHIYYTYRSFLHATERRTCEFYDFQILSWKIIGTFDNIASFEKYAKKDYQRLLSPFKVQNRGS